MPIVSHVPAGSSSVCRGAVQHQHLVACSASGERRSGREEVVGVGAVADGRRLLLEAEARRRRPA